MENWTLEQFENKVSALLRKQTGLDADELVGDWPSADYYETGDLQGAVDWILEESEFNEFAF